MEQLLKEIRQEIVQIAHLSKGPHVGSALSCADIVAALYFKVMRIEKPINENRDRFILSKAHAAMALYATLYKKGFLDHEMLYGYYQNGGTLPAHTDRCTNEYVEISAGSLGHGLPIGVGMAHAMKLQEKDNRVFILMGDGEMQEGSVWEAAMLAPKLGLTNLTVFIDHNNLQGYGRATELVEFYPIEEKWKSFGWDTETIDGHDVEAIVKSAKKKSYKPKVIICNTTKGKDVSFMEDKLIWHYYIVTDEHKQNALKELES